MAMPVKILKPGEMLKLRLSKQPKISNEEARRQVMASLNANQDMSLREERASSHGGAFADNA